MAEINKRQARIAIIVQLAMIYPRQDATPEMFSRFLSDWADDLAEFDPEAISAACRRWRRDPSNRFFPHPGALIELCKVERTRIIQDRIEAHETAHRITQLNAKRITAQ